MGSYFPTVYEPTVFENYVHGEWSKVVEKNDLEAK